MKNRIICLLAIAMLFVLPMQSYAGFIMKKQPTTTIVTHNTEDKTVVVNNRSTSEISESLAQFAPPSFERARGKGALGIISFVCGILGFFTPLFAIGAVVFGFLGMGKCASNRGLAIAGLIMGIVAIAISIFGGFALLPIF